MKTRLKNRIAGFSREQLIDWICLNCVDIRSTHSEEDAQDMIDDIREAIEIGFPAALTAQPVKLEPIIQIGYTQDEITCMCNIRNDDIKAIRAAGHEVQE